MADSLALENMVKIGDQVCCTSMKAVVVVVVVVVRKLLVMSLMERQLRGHRPTYILQTLRRTKFVEHSISKFLSPRVRWLDNKMSHSYYPPYTQHLRSTQERTATQSRGPK